MKKPITFHQGPEGIKARGPHPLALIFFFPIIVLCCIIFLGPIHIAGWIHDQLHKTDRKTETEYYLWSREENKRRKKI